MKSNWIQICGLAIALFLMLFAPKRADALDISPRALSFGAVAIGQTGGPLKVTLSTYFPAALDAISVRGDFAQYNDCPALLPRLGSCTILVSFKPSSLGRHVGELSIARERSHRAAAVALIGSGVPGNEAPGVSGRVMGAARPVSGSSVALWAAGMSGYGKGATQLGTAISAADGSFNIMLTCPSATAQIYLTAQGGDAGAGSNSSLMLMSALGRCGAVNPATPVIINEVTTAGSVYALAQFLSTTSSGVVGAPATNAIGLGNAFVTVANMVDVGTGSARGTRPGAPGRAPERNLNAIANALGACAQSDGAASAQCKQLFHCALPGAVFNAVACSAGIGSTTDTLAATLSIALNAQRVSIDGIYDLATQIILYRPALDLAPHDWSMPVTFALAAKFSFPFGVAIDSSGRVWVTNQDRARVTALNNDGTLVGPGDVAIDNAGSVWITDGDAVTKLKKNGTLVGNFNPAGANFRSPLGGAIDNSGHFWIANFTGNSVTALNNNGTLFGNFAPIGADFRIPGAVAIDGKGHVWVTNRAGESVTALNNDGTLLSNFAPAGSNFDGPSGVAIDGAGHVWVLNTEGNTVTALNNDGTLLGNFAPAGSDFKSPSGVAIDSAGHVWVTNREGNTVTALNNDGTLLGSFAATGANFRQPIRVAIDSSGQVWVTNASGNTVTELVGAAAPVKTPFIGPPQLP